MSTKEKTKKSIVSVVTCPDYLEEQVDRAVTQAVDTLGGIRSFVRPEEKILVKPNFLYPVGAEKAVTTHPSVVRAVIRLLKDAGCEQVLCGDSPAYGSCRSAFRELGLDMDCFTPMEKEQEKEGLVFAREALECDAIIGVSKMKTHMLERITGAVKNMYGLICGSHKAKGHVKYPTAAAFAQMLARIHQLTPQRLHIMDAVVAMEGNGPSSGSPVSMGLILASADPVALDAVFCRLICLDPALVPTETVCARAGIGTFQESEIEVYLDGALITMEELAGRFGKPEFDVQREKEKASLLGLLSGAVSMFSKRPVIDPQLCVRCGLCVSKCPVEGHALSFAKGKENPPVYQYRKCIRCYCCQEICPRHAVYVKGHG